MSNQNGGDDAALPTAVIADSESFSLDRDTGMAQIVLLNPDGKKFALSFEIKIAALLSDLLDKLLAGWHLSHTDQLFGRQVTEASVGTVGDKQNLFMIQFEKGAARILDSETALKLSELIETHVLATMPEADKYARLKKKHPGLIVPRPVLLKP